MTRARMPCVITTSETITCGASQQSAMFTWLNSHHHLIPEMRRYRLRMNQWLAR